MDQSAGVAEGSSYYTITMSGTMCSKVNEAHAHQEAMEWEFREAKEEDAHLAEEEQKKAVATKAKAAAEAKVVAEAKAAAKEKVKAAAAVKASLEEQICVDPANIP